MDDLSSVRVLIVDDSAPWRCFVATQLLERQAQEIETASDGFEAVQMARRLQPDIVVMDIWMPRLNGLAATREIGTFAPQSKILIVSNESDPDLVQAAFAAGARGYVLKSLAGSELLKAIAVIVRGDLFIGGGLTRCDCDHAYPDA